MDVVRVGKVIRVRVFSNLSIQCVCVCVGGGNEWTSFHIDTIR